MKTASMIFLMMSFASPAVYGQSFFDAPWQAFQTGGYDTGRFSVAITAADVNGDGRPDAIIGQNVFHGGIRVVLQQNEPRSFDMDGGTLYPLSKGSWDVTTGDVDGDGDVDLISTNTDFNFTGNTLAVFKNDGSGIFGPAQQFPAGGPSTGVATADVDADGDLDIVAANYGFFGGGSTVSVLFNNGSGDFASPVLYAVGSDPYRIEAGDLDADGDVDLVVARTGRDISVLFNQGNGVFNPAIQYSDIAPAGNSNTVDLVILDVDGDSDLDVAYTGDSFFDQQGPFIVLLHNDGGGTLTPKPVSFDNPIGMAADNLAAADLDGDGCDDLIGSQPFGKGYVILKGDVAAGLAPAEVYPSVARAGESNSVSATTAVDLDGDGDPDVLTVGRLRRLFSVHENPGNGIFLKYPAQGQVDGHQVLDLGDIDGDGDLDVVSSHGGVFRSDVVVFQNDGTGTFSESFRTASDLRAFAKLRDLDSDGTLDLLYVTAPSTNEPYDFFTARGNGDGTFQQEIRWPIGTCRSAHPAAFDIDADGDLDVINTEFLACADVPESGKRLFISINNGNGTFAEAYTVQAGSFPYNLAAGDFNNDGDLDLATSSAGTSAILLGNGDGTFQPWQTLNSGKLGANILALDLNADGNLDVVTLQDFLVNNSQIGESVLSVLLGDGGGAFTQTDYDQHLTQDFREWVAAGDVDNDGDADLLVGGVQDALVFLNNGSGTMTLSGRYGIGREGASIHYADATGDNVGDLIALTTLDVPLAGTSSGITVVPGTIAESILGDVNLDGAINLLDVSPFVDRLTTGTYQAEADVNQDGAVNLLDVAPFVELLSS